MKRITLGAFVAVAFAFFVLAASAQAAEYISAWQITAKVREKLTAAKYDGKLPTVSTILHLPNVPWIEHGVEGRLSLPAGKAAAWIAPLVDWFEGRAKYYHSPDLREGGYRPPPLP